jgi:putative transposase
MEIVQRKITYRLYPNASQETALADTLALHCRVYNSLLEERRRQYEAGEPATGFSAMCRELTVWRRRSSALESLNAQSLQVTARRVDLAFDAFFRRFKAGEKPGYPRFKSVRRFSGWGYKTHGDGWRLNLRPDKHGTVRLSGIGIVRLRGKGRFTGEPKTAEVIRRNGKWYLSVTFNVEADRVARTAGNEVAAFDWGLTTLLTIAKADGSIETIDNPRWLKRRLDDIRTISRSISAEETRIRQTLGLKPGQPIPYVRYTCKLKRLRKQLRNIHGKVARQRHDFYHKLSAILVGRFAFLASEELSPAAMSKAPEPEADPERPGAFLPNGAARKAGLNRGILDAAGSKLLGMLRTKAAEAASVFALANTRAVKPTQRCHRCGALVAKDLSQREHHCACGCVCGRDENAARTLLRWLCEGNFWSGTGQGAAMPPETLSTALCAW